MILHLPPGPAQVEQSRISAPEARDRWILRFVRRSCDALRKPHATGSSPQVPWKNTHSQRKAPALQEHAQHEGRYPVHNLMSNPAHQRSSPGRDWRSHGQRRSFLLPEFLIEMSMVPLSTTCNAKDSVLNKSFSSLGGIFGLRGAQQWIRPAYDLCDDRTDLSTVPRPRHLRQLQARRPALEMGPPYQ